MTIFNIKRCPGCGKIRNKDDKKICSKCGFDFVKLKLKCKSCNNYYAIEEYYCPVCKSGSALYKIHAKDITNVKKIIKYRFFIIIGLLVNLSLLFMYIFSYNKLPFDFFTFSLFLISAGYGYIYHEVKKKPVLSFLIANISLFPYIFFLIEIIKTNVIFVLFIPLYIVLIIHFSLGYEVSWKIQAKEKLKRLI